MAGKKSRKKKHTGKPVARFGEWPVCLLCGRWMEYVAETGAWKHAD